VAPEKTIDWNQAIKYASLVKLAESVKPDEDDSELKQKLQAAGYQLLEPLYASDLATDSDPDPNAGKVVSFGFIAARPDGELVVAIRGTVTILEWLHDGEFLMSESPVKGAGLTDDGFSAMYASLKNAHGRSVVDVVRNYVVNGIAQRVTICGHSLGAAMATLLALDVALHGTQPAVYTYASPRVGDHKFANEFAARIAEHYRIANRLDLVTMVPTVFPVPYEHAGTLVELNPPKQVERSIPCQHHLTTYLWLMGQVAGVETVPLDADCRAAV
jgi:hypothetical protein